MVSHINWFELDSPLVGILVQHPVFYLLDNSSLDVKRRLAWESFIYVYSRLVGGSANPPFS